MIFAIKNIDSQQKLNNTIDFLKKFSCDWNENSKTYRLNFYNDIVIIVKEKK
jgi:hypothetical protein